MILDRLHEYLTLNDPPQPADLIFVLAGRMDRKRHGLELYRTGIAPRLLLSVDRFEVSKMATIDFEGADDLIAQRNKLPADQRHFFCEVSGAGIRSEPAELPRWNTYGEILGLWDYLQRCMPRSILVISSDVHLRRVALSIGKVFPRVPLEVRYYAVPTHDRRYALREMIKLTAYRVILSLPQGLIRRIMRLRY
ncbi:MAG: hypothetical protein ABI806_22565 [Candidatus Solibacter sp.]